MTEDEFRQEVMGGLAYIARSLNQMDEAVGVVRVALEMLCAKHGDDPEVLMKAARDHIKRETEEAVDE